MDVLSGIKRHASSKILESKWPSTFSLPDPEFIFSVQVITWFQNRRAKLKRDVDDSKSLPNDAVKVESDQSQETNETESNNGSADPGSIPSDSKSERCSKRPSLTSTVPSCSPKKTRLL